MAEGDNQSDGEFASWVSEGKERTGRTFQQIADIAGINFTYAQKLASGVRPAPSRAVIERLAAALTPDGADDDDAQAVLSDGLMAAGLLPSGKVAPSPERLAMGERLRARRDHLKLSQAELARMVGLGSGRAIGLYESGENAVTADMVKRLAAALRTSVGYILDEDDEFKAPSDEFLRWYNRLPKDQQKALNVQVKALHDAQDDEDDATGRFGKRAE